MDGIQTWDGHAGQAVPGRPSLEPWDEGFDFADDANNVLLARWPELCDMVALAIIPALDMLIENLHGYPPELDDEDGPGPGFTQALDIDGTADGTAKWREVMVRIRDGFVAHRRLSLCEWDDDLGREDLGRLLDDLAAQRDEGLSLFAKWFPALWD